MENQALKHSYRRSELLEQAREAKTSPGVYLMKSQQGGILYVGKAKNLKNRLLSYFQSEVHEIPRIQILVSQIQSFEVILTETEAEALILEATLIKRYRPKFNIRLKDDKSYPYLKIQLSEKAPRLQWTRRVLKDGARYFGPFPSASSAREVMQLLTETFRLRDCSDNTFSHRSRPCLLHQMGKCSAPCVDRVEPEAYRHSILEVVEILEGKADPIIANLKKAMHQASEEQEYEQAAYYRDQVKNLELVTQTQGVCEAGDSRNRDVIGLARLGADAHGTLLRIRMGRLVSVQHYHLQNTDPSMALSELLQEFVTQAYLEFKQKLDHAEREGAEEQVPAGLLPIQVLLPEAPRDVQLLEQVLGFGVRTAETPVDEQLLTVARTNAQYALEQNQKKTAGHGIEALEEVQEKLHLPHLPHRIECYDISNFQGEDAVASRVVFIDGAADKNLYRRYKIQTVIGANDFAMMKEVLARRFAKTEEVLPDLLVVDGGKGQLAQAVAILEELSLTGVSVVGLAKARVQSDFQAKEVQSSLERVFIPNRKNPVPLRSHMPAYRLLTHIRDEAHRFAVSYHRVLRKKRSLRSETSGDEV
ncbi:MAG: excinuclease ABC subunit UvrC [Bdellovibrionia bacterium]